MVGRIRSLLKFTSQVYSSSLHVSFTPHLKLSVMDDQVLADLLPNLCVE